MLQLWRIVYEYLSRKGEQVTLRIRIRDLATARVSYGYLGIYVLLKREGWKARVYRIYREEGITARYKRPRRHVSVCRRMERSAGYISQRRVVHWRTLSPIGPNNGVKSGGPM